MFDKFDPSGGTGSGHRQGNVRIFINDRFFQAGKQFISFLDDGEVGSEIGIQH